MNEYAQAWIEALESGKYEQTTGALCKVDLAGKTIIARRYCCLGVACEVLGVEMILDIKKYGHTLKILETDVSDEGPSYRIGQINRSERQKLGISKELMEKLITYNDSYKWSFPRIAAFLRSYFYKETPNA